MLIWCKACQHQAPADLEAIDAGGRGNVPLLHLKFCCAKMGKSGMGVQPWRAE
jgi:hypothetical protein